MKLEIHLRPESRSILVRIPNSTIRKKIVEQELWKPKLWPFWIQPLLSCLYATSFPGYGQSMFPAIIIGGERTAPNSLFKIEEATGAHTYKLTTSSGTVGNIPVAWLSAPQLIVTNDEAKTLFVKFIWRLMMMLLLRLLLKLHVLRS